MIRKKLQNSIEWTRMAQNSSRTINHFPSSSSSSLAAAGPRAWHRSCGGHMSVADGLIFRIYKKKIHIWISHLGKSKPNPKGPRELGDLKCVGGAAAREHSWSHREAGTETALVLRAQVCQPFLLVAEPQHLTGPPDQSFDSHGGRARLSGGRDGKSQQREPALGSVRWEEGGGCERSAGVTGGWRCQGRSWHLLLTPAGLAPLSHGNEPSLRRQDHGTAGLGGTSLQRGHRNACPLTGAEHGEGPWADMKGTGARQKAREVREQHITEAAAQCPPARTTRPPHALAGLGTGWEPCTPDRQTDRQTRAHCCGGAATAGSDGADGLRKRSELMQGVPGAAGRQGTLGTPTAPARSLWSGLCVH